MYPTLPFGPLSLPTAPFITLIALWVGLEVAARFGQRMGITSDDIWNTGLLSLLAGLIAARLWNVAQLWEIYAAQPLLVFSLRPSGYAFLPGLIAALIAGYLFMIRKVMDPQPTIAAFSVGALTAASIRSIGAYLTGTVVGLESDLPWALAYYGELLHPAALYRAAGLALLVIVLWMSRSPARPLRTIWLAGLGYSLVRLFGDAFVAGADTLGLFRTSQLLAFGSALLFCLLLIQEERSASRPTETRAESETAGAADNDLPAGADHA